MGGSTQKRSLNGLSCCHTKRRMAAHGRTHPSLGMTSTLKKNLKSRCHTNRTLKEKSGAEMAPQFSCPQDGPLLSNVLVPLCKVVPLWSEVPWLLRKKTAPLSKVAPFSKTAPGWSYFGSTFLFQWRVDTAKKIRDLFAWCFRIGIHIHDPFVCHHLQRFFLFLLRLQSFCVHLL